MNEAEIREQVWAFLAESFLYMRPDFRVAPDESLLRAGVIDSLGVMEVIAFVEQYSGIQVADDEITEANFGTLNGIAQFILMKRGAATT